LVATVVPDDEVFDIITADASAVIELGGHSIALA
jgi:hypothetical protein